MNIPIILCSPRVASRYFAAAFQKKTGINIQKTHSPACQFLDNHSIIGIVRDPVETIASEISMGHFLQNTPLTDYINIDNFIQRYVDTNKKIIEIAQIILMYDNFIDNVADAVNLVVDKLKIVEVENPNYFPDKPIEDRIDPINGYLVSSKTYSQYENIKAKILEYDLCEAYEIYEAARDISRGQL